MRPRTPVIHGGRAARRVLRAGRLTALLDGADLRYVRWDDVEVVRRIYVAVRDTDWGTILPGLLEVTVDEDDDAFSVRCRARHEQKPIVFEWQGTITATSDGVLTYEMDGEARSRFDYAKIGLCVHHPMATAGRPYRGTTPHGAVAGQIPDAIAPQIHVGEIDLPVFPPVTALTIEQTDSVVVELSFDGERFELEDQRNWSDASFKSYSLPADLGYRFQAAASERVRDAVRVTVRGEAAEPPAAESEAVVVELGGRLDRGLPPVGLSLADDGPAGTDEELRLLCLARPSHLRVDLHLGSQAWRERLARADAEARQVRCPLELAIILADQPERELSALAAELLELAAKVARVIVLRESEEATRPLWLAAARGRLRPLLPDAPFFGGTRCHFNELNRNRECVSGADGVAYSLNPQVHAFDDLSLMENLAAQPYGVLTARTFAGSLPVAVSPITLRPRPFDPDPRQATPFGAAWTLASIGALTRAGAASLTYFETTGRRGIVDAGSAYPMYDVFADVGEWSGGDLVELHISDESLVGGLACHLDGRTFLALANLTDTEREIHVHPGREAAPLHRRVEPYEVVRLDIQQAHYERK